MIKKAVTIRLTKEDYDALVRKSKKARLTLQSYGAQALTGSSVQPALLSDTADTLMYLSRSFAEYESDIRHIIADIRKIVRTGNLSKEDTLKAKELFIALSEEITEVESVWQSIRSLISQQWPQKH